MPNLSREDGIHAADKITAYLVKVVGDLREEVKSLKDEIKKLK